MNMQTPNTIEKVAKEHSKETGYRASIIDGHLKAIINKTNAGWSARKIAGWVEEFFPGTPYTTVAMVSRAQRDLGF